MNSKYVFVSYQRKDRFIAETISELISEWGYSVWMDQISISGGSDWQDKIREGIEKSFCVVLCVTSNIEDSHWVVYEVTKASGIHIPIIPLLFVGSVPVFLAKFQGIDFITCSKKEACGKLRKALTEKESEAEQGLFYLECPSMNVSCILKRNDSYSVGRGVNVHLQFPKHFDRISRRHALIETFLPPSLIAYGQNPTYLNGNVVIGKVSLSLDEASEIKLAGYKESAFRLTPIKTGGFPKEVETRSISKARYIEKTRCLGKDTKEQLKILDEKLGEDIFQTHFTGTLVKGAGVKILEGALGQEIIEFKRATAKAGKSSKASGPVEIPIKGDFEKGVVFIIRQFNDEFCLTLPKTSVDVKLNGNVIKNGLNLKDGDIIAVAETTMQFFLPENEKI